MKLRNDIGILIGLLLWVSTCASTVSAQAETATRGEELVELRTLTAKTYARSDGTREAEIGVGPVHYRDAYGRFQDIDPLIVPFQVGADESVGKLFCTENEVDARRWTHANETNGLRTYFDPVEARVLAEGENTGMMFRPVRFECEIGDGSGPMTVSAAQLSRLSPAIVQGAQVT